MINQIFLLAAIALVVLAFVSLYRAIVGPRAVDRIIAINVIATKVAAVIVLLAIYMNEESYIDVALIYAMIAFIATIGVSKYFERGRLE